MKLLQMELFISLIPFCLLLVFYMLSTSYVQAHTSQM